MKILIFATVLAGATCQANAQETLFDGQDNRTVIELTKRVADGCFDNNYFDQAMWQNAMLSIASMRRKNPNLKSDADTRQAAKKRYQEYITDDSPYKLAELCGIVRVQFGL